MIIVNVNEQPDRNAVIPGTVREVFPLGEHGELGELVLWLPRPIAELTPLERKLVHDAVCAVVLERVGLVGRA